MNPVDDASDAVAAEAHAFATLYAGTDSAARTKPTPCTEWSVEDLATHVAVGLFRDAEAFHRARVGARTAPGPLDVGDLPADQVIHLAVEHLRAALQRPPRRWPDIPTPFGAFPVLDAVNSLLIEVGVHLDDLSTATGSREVSLSAATLQALFGFGEKYLLLQAAPVASEPFGYTLSAPSATMSMSWDGRRWAPGATSSPRCVVTGSDDAVARMMLRRIDVGDARLEVSDPHGVAHLLTPAIRPL